MQSHEQITLWKDITAIEITQVADGTRRCGLFLRLPQGAELIVCGSGFNDRTVTVDFHGRLYFVFLQDIYPPDNYNMV